MNRETWIMTVLTVGLIFLICLIAFVLAVLLAGATVTVELAPVARCPGSSLL